MLSEMLSEDEMLDERELVERAAGLIELTLLAEPARYQTEPIVTYRLDVGILVKLEQLGIRREPRTDGTFTLVDQNPYAKPDDGFARSNYCNFKVGEDEEVDLTVKLFAMAEVSLENRGVVFRPRVCASLVSASDQPPNSNFFRALIELDHRAPDVARCLARDGKYVVSFSALGLGGLRSLHALLLEFAGGNDAVKGLGYAGILEPSPEPLKGRTTFVAETAHPRIFQAWAHQHATYVASLRRG